MLILEKHVHESHVCVSLLQPWLLHRYKDSDLHQLDVRVEEVDEATGDRRVLAETCRNETRCSVMKPLSNSGFRRGWVFEWTNAGRPEDRRKVKLQEGRVEKDVGGVRSVRERGSQSEGSFQCCAMWSLSKSDSGGESAFGGRGFWRRHRETECPMEFTMVETFIGEGKEWNSLRPDIAISGSLSRTIHDNVLVLWEYERQIEIEERGCRHPEEEGHKW